MVMYGGPLPVFEINAGYETEHRAGYEAGLSGLPCQAPENLQPLLVLFPDEADTATRVVRDQLDRALSKRRAAWHRGWARGAVDRSICATRERLAEQRNAPYRRPAEQEAS